MKKLILILLFPLLGLSLFTGYKAYLTYFGREMIFPIKGYDPRDLLSGHYLTYEVQYGVKHICSGNKEKRVGYIYWGTGVSSKPIFTYEKKKSFSTMIKGVCEGRYFKAGIERFFIPEAKAVVLDKLIRNSRGSIKLSITIEGKATIKDLLIDGKSWKELF